MSGADALIGDDVSLIGAATSLTDDANAAMSDPDRLLGDTNPRMSGAQEAALCGGGIRALAGRSRSLAADAAPCADADE